MRKCKYYQTDQSPWGTYELENTRSKQEQKIDFLEGCSHSSSKKRLNETGKLICHGDPLKCYLDQPPVER
jgi:hypothetical protein